MIEYFKQNWAYYAIATGISALISYGIGFDDYVRSLSIVLPIAWGVCAFFLKKNSPDVESQEIIKSQDLIIAEQSLKDEEQRKVILDYEAIFDSLLVELPCVCGGNTFQGLFSPNTDNVVQCEKCKQNYKVDINYNTVLVSEPLNVEQTFNQLVAES